MTDSKKCLDCSNCSFKRNIAGDAHISCHYPLMESKTRTILAMSSMTQPSAFISTLKDSFGFDIDLHAVQNGWFSFPENFDPAWIGGECSRHSDLPESKIGIPHNLYFVPKTKALLILKMAVEAEEIEKTENVQTVLNEFKTLQEKLNNKDFISSFSPETLHEGLMEVLMPVYNLYNELGMPDILNKTKFKDTLYKALNPYD